MTFCAKRFALLFEDIHIFHFLPLKFLDPYLKSFSVREFFFFNNINKLPLFRG